MDRREFVKTGLVLGGGAALSGTGLARLAGAAAVHQRYPSVLRGAPADSGIDTIVVCMMENRSFDSYLGWLANDTRYIEAGKWRYGKSFHVDGDQSQAYPDTNGTFVDTYHRPEYPDASPWRGCGHIDPGHSWDKGRAERDGGFLAEGSGNDVLALSYFRGPDLPIYNKLARRFTVCDHWHASLLGPTFPNRAYELAGQSGGTKTNSEVPPDGYAFDNIADRLAAAQVPVADYYTDLPPLILWGSRMMPFLRGISAFYEDAAAGTLPNVSFVNPRYVGDLRTDDHPLGDPRAAQGFVRDVFAAFVRSPQWQRGLFVLTYDEWGGFFDHVRPPHFPDDRRNAVDADDFSQAGFRVPTILCSPRALPGYVDHTKYDHTSILRFIEWRFLGAPAHGPGLATDRWFLTKRDRHAANLGTNLSSAIFKPDVGFDVDLHIDDPEPPCARPGARQAEELAAFEELEQSGYFERLGIPTG